MMHRSVALISAGIALLMGSGDPTPYAKVLVPLNANREVEIGDLISKIAGAINASVAPLPAPIHLPISGFDGSLVPRLIQESLGSGVDLEIAKREVVVRLASQYRVAENRAKLAVDLKSFAQSAAREAEARARRYGMHARASYKPNDPKRPTVCLVHGINASSSVFVHMVGELEEKGFGLVLYDYPFNRDLDETIVKFERDWKSFRKEKGDRAPWSVLAHSMGSLVIRSYLENEDKFMQDVSDVILIGPPNHGAVVARAQAVLQLAEKMAAVNGKRKDPLAQLSDGLGAAAEDIAPGSQFLKDLNGRKRAPGVRYHILAGDSGFLSRPARTQIEAQLGLMTKGRSLFGKLAQFGLGEATGLLDAVTDGLGDGCIPVASTRLDGVADHVVIHANHVELIRAPLFFPDPGPVVSMPYVIDWLKAK